MSLKLGSIVTDRTQLGRRDAFHSPCVLVSCDQHLQPGMNIQFMEGSDVKVRITGKAFRQGIVDPFHPSEIIAPDTPFWMVLCPELVGDLTHQFTIKGGPLAMDAAAFPPTTAAPTSELPAHDDGKEPWEYPTDVWGEEQDRKDMDRCNREGC